MKQSVSILVLAGAAATVFVGLGHAQSPVPPARHGCTPTMGVRVRHPRASRATAPTGGRARRGADEAARRRHPTHAQERAGERR